MPNGLGASVGAVVAATIAISIFANSDSALLAAITVLLTYLQVSAVNRRAGGFTAMALPPLILNGVLLFGMLLWEAIRLEARVSVTLPGTFDDLRYALLIGLIFTSVFVAGAVLLPPGQVGEIQRSTRALPSGGLITFGYGVIGLTLIGRGFALIEAASYQSSNGPGWAVRLSTSLAPLAILALCVACFQPKNRLLAVAGVVAWALITFGLASRTLCLIPALLLLGAFLSPGRRRPGPLAIAGTGIFTILLLQVPLALRGNPDGVGIARLVEAALTTDILVSNYSIGGMLGNVLFAAPLTAVVASRPIALEAFWTSINPLPGVWTDWGQISPTLGLNFSTPYNGLGELAAHGWVVLMIYGFALGLVMSRLSRIAARLTGVRRSIGALAVLALTLLICLDLLQYNLRTGARVTYYLMVVVVALWLAERLRRDVRSASQHWL